MIGVPSASLLLVARSVPPARAIKEYRALLVQDHNAIDAARRLTELAAKANDENTLAYANDRIVELDPFDASGHTGQHRSAWALEQLEAAVCVLASSS